MLEITVSDEFFDSKAKKFVVVPVQTVQLEHSLASLSKWESRYEIPFLTVDERTDEQTIYYIECMCLTPNVPPELFSRIARSHGEQIHAFLQKKHTATFFSDANKPPRSVETITAELIYYWMDVLNIDWEAQYWNINKLFALVRVHNLKAEDTAPKKMTNKQDLARRRMENERRLRELGTNG